MQQRLLFFLNLRIGSFFAKLIGREPYITWKELFREHFINYPCSKFKKILGIKDIFDLEFNKQEIDENFNVLLFNNYRVCWPVNFSSAPVKNAFNSIITNHPDNYFRFYKPKETDVVFDLGACEGVFSLLLLDKVKKIYAFEPLPVLCSALEQTLQNGIDNGTAEVCNYAVGDELGTTDFFFDEDLESATLDFSKLQNPSEKISTPLITLDDFVATKGIEQIHLIKMDVEGAEYAVLRGARRILTTMKPDLLVSAYHYPRDYDRLADFLTENGYQITTGPVFCTRQGNQERPWYRHALIYASTNAMDSSKLLRC